MRLFFVVLVALLLVGGVTTSATPPAHAARVNATCTNGTGDAAAIQSAINSSAAGDEVVIKGPCLLNATLKLLDGRTYRGDSGETVIKQANGANLPAMLASESWVDNVTWVSSNVRIERLTLDGNRAANTGTVPLMLRTWDSRVYDLRVYNAPGDAIRVTSLSQNGTHLANTEVNSIISDVFVENAGGAGIRGVDPDNQLTDWILERSWISTTGGSGVDLDNSAGWQIRDLHIYGVAQHAINAKRCYNTGIHDNYIEDFGVGGAAGTTYFGIRCTLQGDVPSTIIGNKVNQFASTVPASNMVYIGLDGVNYSSGFASVTGNAVVGRGTSRETGLSYAKGGGVALTVASTGNLISGVGTARLVGTGVTVNAGQ